MGSQTFTNLRDATRAITRDMKKRQRRLRGAARKAAREGRNYVIRETVPRAFGELAESIHVEEGPAETGGAAEASYIIADAPHAAAVENGTRPHTPPLAPLVAWVTLRGIQGLSEAGNVRSNRTRYGVIRSPQREVARVVAGALHNRLGKQGAADWRAKMAGAGSLGMMDPDPAVLEVARAIQAKITREGSRPFKYMQQGVEPTRGFLDRFVREALPDR